MQETSTTISVFRVGGSHCCNIITCLPQQYNTSKIPVVTWPGTSDFCLPKGWGAGRSHARGSMAENGMLACCRWACSKATEVWGPNRSGTRHTPHAPGYCIEFQTATQPPSGIDCRRRRRRIRSSASGLPARLVSLAWACATRGNGARPRLPRRPPGRPAAPKMADAPLALAVP